MFGQRRNPFLGTDMPASYTAGLGDNIARRSGFDGAPMVNDSNPYLQQPQSMIAPQMEQPKPKGGGLFGKQSALWKVLGTLGDGLTGNPVYGQMQQQERQTLMQQERERQKAEDAQRAQMEERAYDSGEWDRREAWKRANPEAPNNDTVNDVKWYMGASEAEKKAWGIMNPITQTMGDGTIRNVNPYDLQREQPSTAPQVGTIEDGHRFKGGDPSNPASWEKMGGPASQAPGNFRR